MTRFKAVGVRFNEAGKFVVTIRQQHHRGKDATARVVLMEIGWEEVSDLVDDLLEAQTTAEALAR